jgi:hypothetical protein
MNTKIAFFSLLAVAFSLSAQAQTTAFTYQGRLNDSAGPANGIYDFTFTLQADESGPAPIGTGLTRLAVPVTNGLFSVLLDFNQPNSFTGANRWLEIGARTNGGGAFLALSPRQRITPAPQAIFANTAGNVSGAISLAQLPAAVLTNNQSGIVLQGTFSGNGSGLTNVPGTLPPQIVTGAFVTTQPNQAYDALNPLGTSLLLPTNANVGDSIQVSGIGGGAWQIISSPGQTIRGMPSGLVWLPGNNVGFWRGIAASADGRKIVAVGAPGQISRSLDGGATWHTRDPYLNWVGVASSADGERLVGVVINGQIYTSTDGGTNWTARETNRRWISVASSTNGLRLAAVANGGQIFTSIDGGTNWTPRETTRDWWSIASSADGVKLVAGVAGGQVYTSTDGGTNWTPRDSSRYWTWLASSADGTKLIAAATSELLMSLDGGANWSPREASRSWKSVAMSADGSRLLAVTQDDKIYSSTNSGANWTSSENNRYWYVAAMSADGGKWIAAVGGGDIFTAYQGSALSGAQGASIELTYAGNGVWQPLNLAQVSANPALLNVNQTFTGQNTFSHPANSFSGDGSGLSNLRLTSFSTVTPNRLRSIETPGNEQLYFRAARNLDFETLNDATFWAGRNFTMVVDHDISLRGKHDVSVVVDNSFSKTVALNYDLTVGANAVLSLGGQFSATVGGSAALSLGNNLVIDAANLSLQTGKLRLHPSGAAGLGTPNPQAHLHVYSDDNPTVLRLQSAGGFGAARLEFFSDPQGSGAEWRPGFIQSTDNGNFTGGLSFFVNGSGFDNRLGAIETMRLVNGRVGVGTANPVSQLHAVAASGNGVQGNSSDPGASGVYGENLSGGGYGVAGRTIGWGNGVYGENTSSFGYAGYFVGNVHVTGTLTQPSDRNVKRDFENVDVRDVLEKVTALSIQTWSYTNDASASRHLGPVAQDFQAAFGLGADDKSIATVDADGVALAAIQGLNQKLEESRRENASLKERVENLERMLRKLVEE